MRYDEHISQRLERAMDEKEKQRKAIVADILAINNKMCNLEKICKALSKVFEKLTKKAGKKWLGVCCGS